MLAAHPFSRFAVGAAEISYAASAVGFGIGVDKLTVETGLGDALTRKSSSVRLRALRRTFALGLTWL
jgi:hypothetical protein